jgi:hypothetical protein
MTASEIFEAVTGSGSTDFATLVSILNRRGAWCFIGGLAVNCYVEPVYTLDAEVVVIASELPAIKDELVAAVFSRSISPFTERANGQKRPAHTV